jgi:cytidylate kinase
MAAGICVVAEGRDKGTVVFPHAEFKFFLTASASVRAQRRFEERSARGERVALEAVELELGERDLQDQTRAVAPLTPARDAKLIDSTGFSPEEVVEVILAHMKSG